MPTIAPLRHTPLLAPMLQNLFYPPPGYEYFKRAREVPFWTASEIGKAAWAMDASMLAYARSGATRMTDADLQQHFDRGGLQYEKVGNWSAHGTQAVFASCDDFAIMAFRGTEPEDPADVLADIEIFAVPERDHRHTEENPGAIFGHLTPAFFDTPCLVHLGFQRALAEVWLQVHTLVTEYRLRHPHAEICFTGHSLGAALAVLAFSRSADLNISLRTYGCPRIGNQPFVTRLMSDPGLGIFRYVNEDDTVTHVPTDGPFYRQAPAECLRFDAGGNLSPDTSTLNADLGALCDLLRTLPQTVNEAARDGVDLNRVPAPASLVDHSPARYCFRLWDCV